MRILRTIASVNPAQGGPIEGIRTLTPILKLLGHPTEVVCLDPPEADWLATFPGRVHALGSGVSGYHLSHRWIPWLKTHAPDFDVVIIHGLWQFSSFGTWLALRGSGIPYFVYPHGMLDPWFKRAYPLKHLKKSLYWLLAEYHVLSHAQAVLFTCEEEKILARQSFWPYRCREQVVNYGTAIPIADPEQQQQAFLREFPHLRDQRVFLFLGRLHPKKGCDLLIQAFAAVCRGQADCHLVMAGPDQVGWQKELVGLADRLGVGSQVTFPGMLTGDLKWGAFHTADVFVLPSHQENFGIAVVEALACGIPVLISQQVNIWQEIVRDGAGWAAADTLEGCQLLLEGWLHASSEERLAARAAARRCFANRFDIGQVAQSLVQTLQTSASSEGHSG
ncbi:MAG: glycosyltransferase [Cyanobacteriota bacterium]|nr:glycosyltransferase [Cyanobacteriota bacterium]